MKLYYSPGSSSLASHIALREAGLRFDLERVSLKTKRTASDTDFMRIIQGLRADAAVRGRCGADGGAGDHAVDWRPGAGEAPGAGAGNDGALPTWSSA